MRLTPPQKQIESPPEQPVDGERRWIRYQRGCAAGQLLLIFATYRLWFGSHTFPALPMPWLPNFAKLIEPWSAIVLVMGLLGIAFCSRFQGRLGKQSLTFAVVLLAWLVLIATNQHRLQPWAYQAVLWNLAFVSLSHRAAQIWLSALTISIYVYSSCGKLDYQFLHTVGQDFVSVFLGPTGESVSTIRLWLAALLPLAELAIAIGLIIPKSRRYAGIAAMLMHASLLILLGPWLKSHSWGVLAWNALLIPQAWYLFVAPAQHFVNDAAEKMSRPILVPCCFALAMTFPLSERSGYWDHWLSWSLYSPHTSRVEVEVHETMIERLPGELGELAVDPDGDRWFLVPLEAWSLNDLGVPIYPQARFELGVTLQLARSCELGAGIRAKVRSVANRWTGERAETWLIGESQLRDAAKDYWLLPDD